MEASERDTFEDVAEEIARSFHATLSKYDPETRSRRVVIWEEASEQDRAPFIAAFKKLLIDEVIEPGKAVIHG